MSKIFDVLIIGGGPAGYTAALYASRAGLDTLVIERMTIGGQMAITDKVDNYPGFEDGIDGFTLGLKMQSGAERFGAKTEYAEVSSVDLEGKIKRITTTSGEFQSKTVIIATGANPKALGIEGEEAFTGRGIHYCAHCDGRFYKGKDIAVIGGGNTAVSDALYLSNLASKVYLIHRRDSLRATKIYHEPLIKSNNVQLVLNSKVVGIEHSDSITGIEVNDLINGSSYSLPIDGIFVSIGRKPATELFKEYIELDEFGYIVADESTRTNIDGVFAVGDVRTKELRQIVTAVSDGAVATHYAEEYISVSFCD